MCILREISIRESVNTHNIVCQTHINQTDMHYVQMICHTGIDRVPIS